MLLSLQNVRCNNALPSSSSFFSCSSSSIHQFRAAPIRISYCAPSISMSQSRPTSTTTPTDDDDRHNSTTAAGGDSGGGGGSGSGIHVPRQGYISVSKSVLLDAIISTMFTSQQEEEALQFLYISQCLDSILHAEHKSILEEMRADFEQTLCTKSKGLSLNDFPRKFVPNHKESGTYVNSSSKSESIDKEQEEEADSEMPVSFDFNLNLRQILGSSLKIIKRNSINDPRGAIPVRFQRAFMKLLCNAEFEELSHRDLMLTYALNTDYLLTLPIYVDWKRASESSTIIFRRGYATERQKGLLIAEKLDYLQSKLLQYFFLLIAKPFGRFGIWLNESFESLGQQKDTKLLVNKFKFWLKEFPLLLQPSRDDQIFDDLRGVDELSSDLPIWMAAKKAVARYEGVLSAVGPRERLLRKFLILIGLVTSKPKQAFDLDSESTCSELHLSPSFLSRITLSDIWKPASPKYCGNDFQKMLRTSASVLFSESILQEPAFEQLILLYTEEIGEIVTSTQAEVPSLQMKIYERIPIPDLPVVFPHKKLSFRILDTVRLDVATILGLLAYFLSYKFEDILSSPKHDLDCHHFVNWDKKHTAFDHTVLLSSCCFWESIPSCHSNRWRSALLLDVVAASALVLYVTRVLLGYKQTRDRYQLLVNRTLYEKTVASGFGCIHFLIDASEQQQFKEAILVYAVLLKVEGGQVTGMRAIGDKCERFIYTVFQEKVEMPVEKAIEILVRLGLVILKTVDEQIVLQAVPSSKARVVLQNLWNGLIG